MESALLADVGTANSATSERINLCNMTRRTCREQEVRFILRNLLKVLHQLKLGRVAVFSPSLEPQRAQICCQQAVGGGGGGLGAADGPEGA